MKSFYTKQKIMKSAIALIFSVLNTGSIHAMGFFDTTQNEAPVLETDGTTAVSKADKLVDASEAEKSAEPALVELSDRITRVIDTLDDGIGMRHYSFTSIRGQKVMIFNMKTKTQGPEWNVEYKINGDWTQVPTGHSFISPELSPNQKVLMRVSRSTGMPVIAGNYFMIEFGSAPYINRKRTEILGDYQWFQAYFHDLFFKHHLSWRTSITDSKGHPLEGAMVHLTLNPDEQKPNKLTIKEYITDSSGVISGNMRFDDCIGNNKTPPFSGVSNTLTKWTATYNTGYWSLSVRGNDIGSLKPSPLTQLCTADTLR